MQKNKKLQNVVISTNKSSTSKFQIQLDLKLLLTYFGQMQTSLVEEFTRLFKFHSLKFYESGLLKDEVVGLKKEVNRSFFKLSPSSSKTAD